MKQPTYWLIWTHGKAIFGLERNHTATHSLDSSIPKTARNFFDSFFRLCGGGISGRPDDGTDSGSCPQIAKAPSTTGGGIAHYGGFDHRVQLAVETSLCFFTPGL